MMTQWFTRRTFTIDCRCLERILQLRQEIRISDDGAIFLVQELGVLYYFDQSFR